MSRPPGAAAITESLRAVARASDLRPERRLDAKIAMTPAAVTRRLRTLSRLRTACLAWGRLGAGPGQGGPSSPTGPPPPGTR